MLRNSLKVTILSIGLLFAGYAASEPQDEQPPMSSETRILVALSTLESPNGGPLYERKCTSEDLGDKICVLCEYTAIGETTYKCYKKPDPRR